jgi:hypothetical protein
MFSAAKFLPPHHLTTLQPHNPTSLAVKSGLCYPLAELSFPYLTAWHYILHPPKGPQSAVSFGL